MPKTINTIRNDRPYQDLDVTVLDIIDLLGYTTLRVNFPYKTLEKTLADICLMTGNLPLINGLQFFHNAENAVTRILDYIVASGGGGDVVPVVPSMFRGMLDGDSLSSSQMWQTPTALNTERRAAGYFDNFAAMTNQVSNIRYAQGYGTSGHSAEDIQAGLPAAIAYAQSAVVQDVFLHLGTNDVEGVTAIATLQAIYQDIIGQYANCTAQPYVWVGLACPRGDFEGYTAPERAGFITRLHQIRAAITAAAAAVGVPTRVTVWDAWPYLVDPAIINGDTGLAYFPKVGYYNADGVHFVHKGAHWVGKALKTAYYSVRKLTNPIALPSITGAYNTNPTLAGAFTVAGLGTGATGLVAPNIQVTRSTGTALTAVCSSEVTDILGVVQVCQKIVLSGATGAEELFVNIQFPANNYVFDGTTGIEMMCYVKIAPGHTGLNGCYTYTRAIIAGSSYTNKDMAFVSGNVVPNDDPAPLEWLLRSEPLTVPAGTSTTHQGTLRIPVDGTVVGNNATIWVGQSTLKLLAP